MFGRRSGGVVAGKQGQKGKKPTVLERRYNRDFLARLDARGTLAIVLRRRLDALEQDLGGQDELSYQQRSLTRRAIWVEQRLLELEDEYGQGRGFAVDEHVKLLQTLIAVYSRLGLVRRAKPVKRLADVIAEAQP